MNNIRLEAKRLLLRSLIPDDATDAYVGWLNDKEVNQYLESRFTLHTIDSTKKYIEDTTATAANVFLAIVRRDNGQHIGNIKLGPIDEHHRVGDIGLMIGDKDSWGKGYATEAISLITDYAFKQLGLRKVTAGAYENNVGSIKAFLKVGFVEEARKKAQFLFDGKPVDHVLLAKFQ